MFDATAAGESATSLVDVEEATAIFADSLSPSGWDWEANFSLKQKQQALMEATRDLQCLRYKGYPATHSQRLAFPRCGQREPFPQIPEEVKQAVCLQARYRLQNLASGGRSRAQQLQAQGVRAFQVGDHSQEFAPGAASLASIVLCVDARALLHDWIAKTGRVTTRARERCNRNTLKGFYSF
ncbi:MAG: hypothetical protein J0I12_11140 [Candidatus Eremiobacteraeota bacterium]|nr:hypothetical protein [Candidatus Eremiobacteraeota bacterium]